LAGTLSDLQDLLAELQEAVDERFAPSARKEQFDHHLKTVSMCLDHLFDEDTRHLSDQSE
jgi:hypothetical protein